MSSLMYRLTISEVFTDQKMSSDIWAPKNVKVWTRSTRSPWSRVGAGVCTTSPEVQNELFFVLLVFSVRMLHEHHPSSFWISSPVGWFVPSRDESDDRSVVRKLNDGVGGMRRSTVIYVMCNASSRPNVNCLFDSDSFLLPCSCCYTDCVVVHMVQITCNQHVNWDFEQLSGYFEYVMENGQKSSHVNIASVEYLQAWTRDGEKHLSFLLLLVFFYFLYLLKGCLYIP